MRWPRHADSPSRRLRTRDFCCTKSSLATRARTPERSRVGKTLSARSICSTRFRDFGVGMTGSLMTPFLVIIFGIHPATTMGTDLLYAAATKSAGTLIHGLHSTIDWRVVGRLAGGALGATCVIMLYPRLPTASIVGSIDWHCSGFCWPARCPGSCSAAIWPRGFRIPSCASVLERR